MLSYFFNPESDDTSSPIQEIECEKSLSYKDGKDMMMRLYAYYREINAEKPEISKIIVRPSNSVEITSPGKKRFGDYRVTIEGQCITHKDMCDKIYSYIIYNTIYCADMKQILEEMYTCGYVANPIDTDFIREFKKQIFWLTLQEDINYPIEERKLGRKHPLFRYAEAFIAAQRWSTESDLLLRVHENADNLAPKGIRLFDTNGVIAPNYYNVAHYLN